MQNQSWQITIIPVETITLNQNVSDRCLLVALAHPDDESFGAPPVGTILRYAHEGVAVHYACATRGEAGSADAEMLQGFDSLGALRTHELQCAAQILGLTAVHFLNYRDSGMENSPDNHDPASLVQAPLDEVAEKLARLIRQIKPQVVLTFDASGGYFHPDHIKMYQATTRAFHAAGNEAQFVHLIDEGLPPYQPQKLYYLTIPQAFVRLMVNLLPWFGKDPAAFGRNNDLNIKRIAEVEQQITTTVAVGRFFAASQQAADCHASQKAGLPAIPKIVQRWLGRRESFTRVVPPPQPGEPIETDLFANVVNLTTGKAGGL
ncbi:MAG: PIG-L deacetylase family protein [Anaerolineae bacterium]|nr:PIG-L deacetylase family protein [Anaerolineae bacterium]